MAAAGSSAGRSSDYRWISIVVGLLLACEGLCIAVGLTWFG